ncbi:MAG: hypothetical protein M1826_007262 [Phylliscum demangeonii]|nr:MAG: hypothetical protein M1826_007262 [Phylliscum demangeonii]
MAAGWIYNVTPAVEAQSQYPTIIAVCVALTTVMSVVIGLRLYVRAIMIRSVGADDYTILFAAVCSIVYNALAIAQSRWGLGLPLALRPAQNTLNYKKLNYSGRPLYMAGITGFKVALCLAYLRIVPSGNRVFKPVIWAVGISCVLAHLAGTLVLLFQCLPLRKNLRPTVPGHCLPDDKTFYALAIVTIVFDCVIFLLPIPLLVRVQINRRRKIALLGVFLLGLFTTVCSLMRLLQIRTITKNGNSTMLVFWGTIEMNVGIALTCLPTLTPLFHFLRGKTVRSGPGYKEHGSHTGSSYLATGDHVMEIIPAGAGGGHRGSRHLKRAPVYAKEREREREREKAASADGSSQESILGLESAKDEGALPRSTMAVALPSEAGHAVAGHPRLPSTPSPLGGITRTMDVDVRISRIDHQPPLARPSHERDGRW